MAVIHANLAEGHWQKLTLAEQLGNIGSEIERAVKWKEKQNQAYFLGALTRALELFDLTLSDKRWQGRYKELARAREVVCDALTGKNIHQTSWSSLQKYFLDFALLARKNK